MSKDIKIADKELDTDNYLFNADGQTINLRTRKIKMPCGKDLITKKAILFFAKEAKCSTRDMFLLQIFNKDIEIIRFVQKAMGY